MIEVVEETGSTNADLLARLNAGEALAEGHWLRAERQSGGRGRLGRQWDSGQGNLLCSTIVRLQTGDPTPATLSMVAGLAVYDTVERCLFDTTPMLLKWPNDVLVFDGKVAGILLERHEDAIVVGIGINVAYAPDLPDRKTECLARANDKFMGSPDKVLAYLADDLANRLKQWRDQPLSHTITDWCVRSHRYKDKIRITGSNGEVMHAHYRGVTPDGALKVQPLGAHETIVHAGDVTLDWHDEE